jgi:uncharacterized membrane protein (UPF0127 family)
MNVINKTRNTVLADKAVIVDTLFTRMKGLLGRAGLARGEALVIRPCNSIHTFFMSFCIDVVFLDRTYKVLKVVKNLKSWHVVMPVSSASSVLELKPGFADKYGIKEGITLLFEFSDCNEK